MNEKLNIEELFKSKLEGMEYTPSPKVWERTSRALRRREFLRFNPRKFNIFYVAGVILVGIITTIALQTEKAQGARHEAQGGFEASSSLVESNQNADPRSLSEVVSSPNYVVEGQQTLTNSEPSFAKDFAELRPSEKATADGAIGSEPSFAKDFSEVRPSEKATADGAVGSEPSFAKDFAELRPSEKATADGAVGSEQVATLITYFTPSVYEGCAPLEVEFINTSINAQNFKWNFGANESSYSLNAPRSTLHPSFTYKEPGTYTVTLTATNSDGVQLSHSEQITVHPKPKADFEIADGSIYNYSTDASEYEWLVFRSSSAMLRQAQQPATADGERISKDFQPDFEATSRLAPRASRLFLIASTSLGCSDTTSHLIPEAVKPTLRFPNAFSPNTSGSTGGYYNINEPSNLVFYPKYSERPTTYTLQIFNKAGEKIFETMDITIGWDGYYKEAPAAQGVYIYQCTGTWKNGEAYNYRGDITILWTEN